MPTFPLATLSAQVTSTGVSYPSFQDTLTSLQTSFQQIYGSDAYVAPDSQDGQWLSFLAQCIYDSNQAVEAGYLSFSPDFAQGVGLSALVKLNGLRRLVPTNSTASVLITGAVGTVITAGQVADNNGNVWNLPPTVTIGVGGTVTTTATAAQQGSVTALAGTITTIRTPTLGWGSVTNPSDASPGAPVELDPALRTRQANSVALPSSSPLAGVFANVSNTSGVTEVVPYENDTETTNAQGLPAHSISMVVTGGTDAAVANAINVKKCPGTPTYGTTSVTITDVNGLPKTINFFRPTGVPIALTVNIKALPGYSSVVGTAIKQALVDYVTALLTGQSSYTARLYLPAQLYGNVANGFGTFELLSVLQAVKPASPGTADLTPAIYQNYTLALADVNLVVT